MHRAQLSRDQRRDRETQGGGTGEAEKERTQRKTRRFREMERDKKTERDAETVRHRHQEVTRKGKPEIQKKKTSQVSGGASHWPTHDPQLRAERKSERKAVGAPATLEWAPTSLGVGASGLHSGPPGT